MAHLHDVIDDDLHFKIDPDTRKIYRTSENPIVIVQNDHNSERLTFEIPSVIDGHDMKLCNNVRIHFLNVDIANPTINNAGIYESTDSDFLEGDDNTLVFTWLIHRESTVYAGPLNFAISFQCTSEKTEPDGSTSTIVEYSWNTLPDTEDVIVSGGMDNSDVITGEDYYDVVDTWLQTITNLGETTKADMTAHANAEILNIQTSANSAGAKAKQSIRDFAEEVKANLGKQALSDAGIIVQETGSATDKVMSQDATTKAMEEAKTFASSEASNAQASFNERYTELENAIGALETYKRLTPEEDGSYELEKNKLYYICRGEISVADWQLFIRCEVRDWTIQTTNGGTLTKDDVNYAITIPDFRNRTPDIYGFQIRVINDGSLQTRLLNGNTQKLVGELSYEIIRGHDVDEYTETHYDTVLGYTEDSTHCVFGTETYARNGLYVVGADAVYEINEDPASAGTTFTVDANGISIISKTGTSGLTDTYTIVLDDGTTKTFTVTNGDGIKSVTTPEYDDYETTYLVTFDSGATFSFKAPNANSIGIKTPATGTVIHAEDVIPAEHRVDVKVRSKNLIKYPYISQNLTINGITFTANDDQSVTVTGSVPTAGLYAAYKLADVSDLLEVGKTYRIGGSNKILFAYKDTSGTTKYVRTGAFTWSNAYTFVQLYLQYQSTDGEINETVYPYLYVEGESDGYTPYVDVSTVKLTRCGKNMVDINKIAGIGGTDKITKDGDVVTINAGAQYGIRIMHEPDKNDGVCLKAGETYTLKCNLSGEHDADSWGWRLFDITGSAVVLSRSTELIYTPSKDIQHVNFYIAMGQAIETPVVISNIQIEKGPVATEYEPYSGVDYEIYSNGQPTTIITSTSPTMALVADKPGVIIDATYNVDQTAAYNKLKQNTPGTSVVGAPVATRVLLTPGNSYVLKPDHMYFIHGSADNSLQILNSVTGANALTTVTAASDIQAMIASDGDGTNYGQMFICHVKDNAVLIYSGTGDVNTVSWKPAKIEQIFAPQTMVKNIHATEDAYVYDYGCL